MKNIRILREKTNSNLNSQVFPVPIVNYWVDLVKVTRIDRASFSYLGTPGGCTSQLCRNGGRCEEKVLGSSRYAYCQCSPGYTGQFCQQRKCQMIVSSLGFFDSLDYFTCPQWGSFTDTVNCKYGRYFQCIDRTPIVQSCQKGYRFNPTTMQCTWNAPCP